MTSGHKQQGTSLIVSLIILFLLTMMAVRESTVTVTTTRMATNAADALIAFATAEGALNQAVNNLFSGHYAPNDFFKNTNGLYYFDPTDQPIWTQVDWQNDHDVIKGFQGDANSPASWVIERLPSVVMPGQSMTSVNQLYRITVRSVGASGTSPMLLQQIVSIPGS